MQVITLFLGGSWFRFFDKDFAVFRLIKTRPVLSLDFAKSNPFFQILYLLRLVLLYKTMIYSLQISIYFHQNSLRLFIIQQGP